MEKRTRVLLADANEEFRILLRQLLEETGEFEVAASTGDGPMVMELVRRTKPELILMDVVLPGLDGFGILRQLAEEPGERKVIVISAFCWRWTTWTSSTPSPRYCTRRWHGAFPPLPAGWSGPFATPLR